MVPAYQYVILSGHHCHIFLTVAFACFIVIYLIKKISEKLINDGTATDKYGSHNEMMVGTIRHANCGLLLGLTE